MKRILLIAACFLASCSSKVTEPTASPSSPPIPVVPSPLGTNIDAPSYWSTQLPFIDLFKYSKPWVSGDSANWDNGNPIATDSNGWVTAIAPGQIVRTIMLDGQPASTAGRYVMTWDGSGTFSAAGGCSLAPGETSANRAVLDVTGKVMLYFTDTDPVDYMRNIRVVQETYESVPPSDIWNPEFLASLGDESCLRFMDMCRTNGSVVATWADRPKVDDCRYTSNKGMPYELAIEMANTTSKDAWICVPHLATDAFVTSLADMVRDNLHPSLKCYVEYSNEVWNGIFDQATYAESMGVAQSLGSSPFQSRLRYYSRRSVEIFTLFTDSYGLADRLVRVISSQAGNAWTAEQVLSFEDAYLSCDALAIAPYFGPSINSGNVAQFISMTPNDLLDYVEANSMSIATTRMVNNAAKANEYGVPMIAYEGGQHIVGFVSAANRDQITNLISEANRSPRMEGIYDGYLDSWRQSGGQLFMHYTKCGRYSQYGCWGSIEWQGQPMSATPKARALHEFRIANPKWW